MQSSAAAGTSWTEWLRAAGTIIVITGVSTVVMGTLPLLNGLFAERLKLDWHDLGWLGTAAQSGTLVGTLLGYWLIERGALRNGLRFGAICAAIAWLFAATAAAFAGLVACRVITAIGLGCVFSIGTYCLAHTALPARGFSVMSGVQVVCGSAHAAVLPWLHARFGYTIAVASIAAWFLLILILAQGVSRTPFMVRKNDVAQSPAEPGGRSRYAGAELLLSVMAFQMAAATFWSYSERVAAASGLSDADIAMAIALGNLGGIPTALLGALVGERFGFLPILLLATLATAGGEIGMAHATTAGPYLIGQLLFNFGWMLGVSYYLALLARCAGDSRVIQAAPIALVLAGMFGSLSIALFSGSDSSTLLVMSLTLGCVALIPVVARRA